MAFAQRRIKAGSLRTSASRETGKEWLFRAGGTISANDLVTPNGTNTGSIQVVRCDADAEATVKGSVFIARHAAVTDGIVRCAEKHVLVAQNTGGLTAKDPVFVSATAGGIAIGLTNKPAAPAIARQVGEVMVVSATVGVVLIDPGAYTDPFATAMSDVMLPDNQARAWVVREGANDYIVISTENAGPYILLSQRLEMGAHVRLRDTFAVQFGTPGTDLVFTPDGTDVVVTGTGLLRFADALVTSWGTGGDAQISSDGTDVRMSGTGDFVYADSFDTYWGTGKDLRVYHNSTNSFIESITGNLTIDNQLATGHTYLDLGTDTSATSMAVRNNSGASLFEVFGNGQAVLTGGLRVTGDIFHQGASYLGDAEQVDLRANYLAQNLDYVAAVAVTGGRVVNYLPTATADTTVGAGVVTAGVDGVSNPTITTVGAATFAAADIVMISGSANNGENDGLYEVVSHAANVLTLRSTSNGITNRVEDFTLDQLVANAGDVGMAITKITVAVDRAGTDGRFEAARGAVTPLVFSDYALYSDIGQAGGPAAQASIQRNTIADPGNGGAISVATSGVCNLTTAAAETRTLAAPSFIGQRIGLSSNVDAGDCVITVSAAFNQDGDTIITLNDAGDYVELVAVNIAGALRWRESGDVERVDTEIGAAQADATAALADAVEAKEQIWPMAVFGAWAIDGDGAETNGAGMVGTTPTLTLQAAALAKCDNGGVFGNLGAGPLAGYTNNWQLYPDAPLNNDAFYCGAAVEFCEMALDMSATVQVSTGACITPEYWNGAAWAALTIVRDGTSAAAQDGTRPFERDGAIAFIPPADWATTTIDGQLAYWIRFRVSTQANMGVALGQTNAENHSIVTPNGGFVARQAGTITTIRLCDGAAALHTTADVIFILMNYTTGESTAALAFSQDIRCQRFTGLSLAVAVGDVLGVLVTQEDGVAEPSGVFLELGVTLT